MEDVCRWEGGRAGGSCLRSLMCVVHLHHVAWEAALFVVQALHSLATQTRLAMRGFHPRARTLQTHREGGSMDLDLDALREVEAALRLAAALTGRPEIYEPLAEVGRVCSGWWGTGAPTPLLL